MPRFILNIPGWRPALANELDRGWRQAHKLKTRDYDNCYRAMIAYAVPAAAGPRSVLCFIAGPFRRLPDPDAPWKSLLDALKRAGAIKDDSAQWCRFSPAVFSRARAIETTLIIEDTPCPPSSSISPFSGHAIRAAGTTSVEPSPTTVPPSPPT